MAPGRRTPRGRVVVLSIMLFLEHAIRGAWVPILPLHLQDLHFSGSQIGAIYAMLALAAILAPWLGGQLADRIMPAQLVLLLAHLIGAVTLWLAASATDFHLILLLLLLNSLVYMPTLSLSTLIVFRHLADREREFGPVRMWGTASWIVVAGMLWLWLSRPAWLPGAASATTADALRLGALLSVLLAGYSLALPATPPDVRPDSPRLAAAGALRILAGRSNVVFMLVSFLLAMGLPFAYPFGGLFLRTLGASDAQVAPLMALGQVGEVFAFLLLALVVTRIGLKATFLIGVAAWAVRFAIWSAGGPWPLVVASLGLHGLCFAFVLGLGQVYVDQISPPDVRASSQALHQVLTFGLGGWVGNLLAGAAVDHFTRVLADGTRVVDYGRVYFWPAVGAGACFVLFAWLFTSPRPTAAQRPSPPDLSI